MTLEQEQEILLSLPSSPEWFGVFFDEYYDTIFRYVLKRIEDTEVALDITSETFLLATRNIRKYTYQWVSILHWFYRIASNEVAQYYRKTKYETISLEQLCDEFWIEFANEESIDKEYQILEDELEALEHFQIARKELLTLPIKYQEVITLRFLESKSIKEISFILMKPEWTIKSLISRWVNELQKHFFRKNMQPKFQ